MPATHPIAISWTRGLELPNPPLAYPLPLRGLGTEVRFWAPTNLPRAGVALDSATSSRRVIVASTMKMMRIRMRMKMRMMKMKMEMMMMMMMVMMKMRMMKMKMRMMMMVMMMMIPLSSLPLCIGPSLRPAGP